MANAPTVSSQNTDPTREGARAVILAAATIVLVAGVRFAAPFLVPLLLAIFLAIATHPMVVLLHSHRVPRLLAVAVGLLTDLLVLSSVGLLLARSVRSLSRRIPTYQQRLAQVGQDTVEWLATQGIAVPTDALQDATDAEAMVQVVTGLLQATAGVVSRAFLIVILVAFMLVEAPHLRRRLGGGEQGGTLQTTARVRRYLLVKSATSLATGVCAALLCLALGIDLPLLWGTLAYLLNYIPTVGSFIAAVPVVIVALSEQGLGTAAGAAAGYLAINTVIGAVLDPRLMGQAVGLSPLVVLLSMLLWGFLLGPVGALLSAPLTMLARDWMLGTRDLRGVARLLGAYEEPNA